MTVPAARPHAARRAGEDEGGLFLEPDERVKPSSPVGRRPPVWHPVFWLATWFGAGALPRAPGTFGALAALPFAFALTRLGGPWLLFAAAWAVFALGLVVARRYMARVHRHDPGDIVIDEVAGQWLTLAPVAAGAGPLTYLAAFALFRGFDILKPWPVKWADRRVPGAAGVMIDDVLAAAYAAPLLVLLDRLVLP